MHTKKMRIGTLFSGIGAPEQGAKRVYGDDLELVFACEYDKFARQSFEANYEISPEHFHKDVHDMDGTQYQGKVDVLIGGSPCQAFSIAGLRNGTDDERGQLIYQYIRIVGEVKAPIIVYENVKGMLSIDGGKTICDFVQALRDIGYFCHYEVVNTKDYGVPQNRERIFLVGFLDHEMYHRFQFAPKVPLEKRLKDILEYNVDEKYYLNSISYEGFTIDKNEGVVGMLDIKGNEQIRRVYGTDGTAPCLQTMQGGNREPKIMQLGRGFNNGGEHEICPTLTKCSFEQNNFVKEPKIMDNQGRLKKQENPKLLDFCPTLIAQSHGNEPSVVTNRIRKLTPRECLRLQDFPDSFIQVVSDSQMYKQAGNSMSVNVLEMIFRQIDKAINGQSEQQSLFDF